MTPGAWYLNIILPTEPWGPGSRCATLIEIEAKAIGERQFMKGSNTRGLWID